MSENITSNVKSILILSVLNRQSEPGRGTKARYF